MALSERDRARYARHLLLSQLGEAGQERLLRATVQVAADADAGAAAVARTYLERAGVSVRAGELACEKSASSRPLPLASSAEVARIAGSASLVEATRALLGALAAVEAIQQLAALPSVPFSSENFAISSEEA